MASKCRVRRFHPAPGYTAELSEGERAHLSLRQGDRLVMDLESPGRIRVDQLPPFFIVNDIQGDWRCISHVLRLSPQYAEIGQLKTIWVDSFRVDARGRLTARTWDDSMWPRPYPPVTLRWNSSGFQPAPDLREQDLQAETVSRWLEVCRKPGEGWDWRLRFVFNYALYTGHPEICGQALQACPAHAPEKRLFLANYRQSLQKSRWGSSLVAGVPRP